MKSLWASLLLLCLIFLIAFADVAVLRHGIAQMESICEEMAQNESITAEKYQSIETLFRKYRLIFSISLQMESVDNMENSLILLNRARESENAAEISAALSSLRFSIYRLKDGAIPSFETIF